MKKISIILATCLLVGQYAYATGNMTFSSDGTIQDSDIWDLVNIYDTPPAHTTVNMTGGNVGEIGMGTASTLNISGGIVLAAISVYDQSTVNVYGGTLDGFMVSDSSVINLRGGSIGSLWAMPSATVNVFGYDLNKIDTGGIYGDGLVTGFWQNHSPFTINLSGSDTYTTVNLVPEPATFLLIGAGILFIRKLH